MAPAHFVATPLRKASAACHPTPPRPAQSLRGVPPDPFRGCRRRSSRSFRSSRRVNIASSPDGVRGHNSCGRSQYSSMRVLVRVTQIEGFAHPVIAGSIQLDPRCQNAAQTVGRRPASRIENRGMVQARRPRGGGGLQALPGVEADVVVMASCGNERRLGPVPLRDLEAEDAAVEPDRPFQVGHLEVDMTDPDLADPASPMAR